LNFKPFTLTFAFQQILFPEDARLSPVTITHMLKLYEDAQQEISKKPVVRESYEELVFWEPAETFYRCVHLPSSYYLLQNGHRQTSPPNALEYCLFSPLVLHISFLFVFTGGRRRRPRCPRPP
jgi:hypothetical protein